MNDNLINSLKKEQDYLIATTSTLENNQKTLQLIADKKTIPPNSFQIIISLMSFIGIGLCASYRQEEAVFGFCIFFIIFTVAMGSNTAKEIIKNKLHQANLILETKKTESIKRLEPLFNALLPEIHNLRLFDVNNAKNKTSAKYLNTDFIIKYILTKEIKKGKIEKIEFKDQKSKQTQTLYKSLIANKNNDVMERIELQID